MQSSSTAMAQKRIPVAKVSYYPSHFDVYPTTSDFYYEYFLQQRPLCCAITTL